MTNQALAKLIPPSGISVIQNLRGQIADIKTAISERINHANLNGKPELADAFRELREAVDKLTA